MKSEIQVDHSSFSKIQSRINQNEAERQKTREEELKGKLRPGFYLDRLGRKVKLICVTYSSTEGGEGSEAYVVYQPAEGPYEEKQGKVKIVRPLLGTGGFFEQINHIGERRFTWVGSDLEAKP